MVQKSRPLHIQIAVNKRVVFLVVCGKQKIYSKNYKSFNESGQYDLSPLTSLHQRRSHVTDLPFQSFN